MVDVRIGRLIDLLAQERDALLSGNYSEIARLAEPKAAAFRAVSDTGDTSLLIAVGKELRRNQSLLGAALDGVREAARRQTERRNVSAGFAVYDRQGAVSTVSARPDRGTRRV